MKLWITGKYLKALENDEIAWDFKGVFSSKKEAISACHDDNYFIGPAKLNEKHKDETILWPDCYYPHLEKRTGK